MHALHDEFNDLRRAYDPSPPRDPLLGGAPSVALAVLRSHAGALPKPYWHRVLLLDTVDAATCLLTPDTPPSVTDAVAHIALLPIGPSRTIAAGFMAAAMIAAGKFPPTQRDPLGHFLLTLAAQGERHMPHSNSDTDSDSTSSL